MPRVEVDGVGTFDVEEGKRLVLAIEETECPTGAMGLEVRRRTRAPMRSRWGPPAGRAARRRCGARLVNRDLPQEVVRWLLDHDSPQMTAYYTRLHDTTARRHWGQARKANIKGEAVTVDPNGPLADAAWAKQRVGASDATPRAAAADHRRRGPRPGRTSNRRHAMSDVSPPDDAAAAAPSTPVVRARRGGSAEPRR